MCFISQFKKINRVEENKLAELIAAQAKNSKQAERLIRELDSNTRQINNLEEAISFTANRNDISNYIVNKKVLVQLS